MQIARRGFLGFLGAAPIAAPVMAREAAAKAGLGEVVAFSKGAAELSNNPWAERLQVVDQKGHAKWLAEQVKNIMSPERRREAARLLVVKRLDPDLASSRSLSLSAAMRIQKERLIEAHLAQEAERWKLDFKQLVGVDWTPDWS